MKKKWSCTLIALLLVPLVTQAEWIYTKYWPYIYRYEGNWEYSYTPSFWAWNYETSEYSLRGEPVSAHAPESVASLRGIGIDLAGVGRVYLDGPNYESNGPVFTSPRGGVCDPIIEYSY